MSWPYDEDQTPCPHCGQRPQVERCEPWPWEQGPAPWYVGCYRGGRDEHFFGVNGDTKADALRLWGIRARAFLEQVTR